MSSLPLLLAKSLYYGLFVPCVFVSVGPPFRIAYACSAIQASIF